MKENHKILLENVNVTTKLKFLKYVFIFTFKMIMFLLYKSWIFLLLTLKFIYKITKKDFLNYRKFVKSDTTIFFLDILNWLFLITPVIFGLKFFWRLLKCFFEFLFFLLIWFFSFLIFNYTNFDFLVKVCERHLNVLLRRGYDYYFKYREIHISYPEITLKLKNYKSFFNFFIVARKFLINAKLKIFRYIFSWENSLSDPYFYLRIFFFLIYTIYDTLKLIIVKMLWRRWILKTDFWVKWRARIYAFLKFSKNCEKYVFSVYEDILWAYRYKYLYTYIKVRIFGLCYLLFFYFLYILEFIFFDIILNCLIIIYIETKFKYQKIILYVYHVRLFFWFVYFYLFTELGRFIFFSNDCKRAIVYINFYIKHSLIKIKWFIKFCILKSIYIVKFFFTNLSCFLLFPLFLKFLISKAFVKISKFFCKFKSYRLWLLEVRIYYAIKYLFTVQKFMLELYLGRKISFLTYCFLLFIYVAYWCFVIYNVLSCLVLFLS
jgi:hypothetical protein